MSLNNEDLILQFARGTQALSLVAELGKLERTYQNDREDATSAFEKNLRELDLRFASACVNAYLKAQHAIEDLTPDSEVTADDERYPF